MKLIPFESGVIDLARAEAGELLIENTLQSAVIISLLTDRRAETDDRLPVEVRTENPIPADRRGWVGDAFGGHRIGSRLWLLKREKQTTETLRRAVFYVEEALQWLKDDGLVVSIDVTASWRGIGRLDLLVRLGLPGGDSFETLVQTGNVYVV